MPTNVVIPVCIHGVRFNVRGEIKSKVGGPGGVDPDPSLDKKNPDLDPISDLFFEYFIKIFTIKVII